MRDLGRIAVAVTWIVGVASGIGQAAEINRGADERSPSRSEYFSWINNTNEGATEAQTFANLEFFRWLYDEYGMRLDIYAFDAGAIDGKRFYGKVGSPRFQKQFPDGFEPIVDYAAEMGVRLGVWGGPDGFGDTALDEAARIEQMVSLCRDLNFALFKFDAVCGPLRPEKEDAFIRMMTECRRHSPDLILLNHRLGLERAQAHATTFLWEGKETYVDVFSTNRRTAPHHRADALRRGLVPGLARLTEDHGVCLSSSLDHWEDDLVLQAFNRALILAPQIYGNPWLLRDDEFPRLARIFNLHRKYRHLLVEGMVLPEENFGPAAVSRGDGSTRILTLRNLGWQPVRYEIPLDHSIGLAAGKSVHVRRFHPSERVFGDFRFGERLTVEVAPFRAMLLLATTGACDEIGVLGADFEVLRDVPGRPVRVRLVEPTEDPAVLRLVAAGRVVQSAQLDGRDVTAALSGDGVAWPNAARPPETPQLLARMRAVEIPADAEALYEATVFAADNNALEVRSLERSGPTTEPAVATARAAFFNQPVFRNRGLWDRFLFDGDFGTGFWPSRKYGIDQRVKGGCFRLDLGEVMEDVRITLHTPDEYSLQPLLLDEANWVEASMDLRNWRRLRYMAGTKMTIDLAGSARYLRFPIAADRLVEITGEHNGAPLDRSNWRASNLFAHPSRMEPAAAWHARIRIDEKIPGGKLCIAIEGTHGIEGAYAAVKIGDRYFGAPDRSAAYPSNTWEYVNARRETGYTYFVPITDEFIGRDADVFVLAYDRDRADLAPEIRHCADPVPSTGPVLEIR